MNRNRIMVIGCPGAGKTTFSKELGKHLNLPVVHLDVLNWRDNWTPVSQDIFDNQLLKEIKADRWIIDGNYGRTIPLRLKYADAVVYMDYSRITCIFGALKRVIMNYGRTREDMGSNCPERFDMEFMKYVWTFNKINRERYYQILSERNNIEVFVVRNRREGIKLMNKLSGK